MPSSSVCIHGSKQARASSMSEEGRSQGEADQLLKLSGSIIKVQQQMERLLAMQSESTILISKLSEWMVNLQNESSTLKNQIGELRSNQSPSSPWNDPPLSATTCDPAELFSESPTLQQLPRVLVVEDDAAYQWLVMKYLQSRGIACIVVESASEALLCLQGNSTFDLILMDIQLSGGISGLDATKRIRSWGQHLPIVGMAAAADPVHIREYITQGMNAVLPKPFTRDHLLRMVDQFCRLRLEDDFTRTRECRSVKSKPLLLPKVEADKEERFQFSSELNSLDSIFGPL